jgi:hypothetical protein
MTLSLWLTAAGSFITFVLYLLLEFGKLTKPDQRKKELKRVISMAILLMLVVGMCGVCETLRANKLKHQIEGLSNKVVAVGDTLNMILANQRNILPMGQKIDSMFQKLTELSIYDRDTRIEHARTRLNEMIFVGVYLLDSLTGRQYGNTWVRFEIKDKEGRTVFAQENTSNIEGFLDLWLPREFESYDLYLNFDESFAQKNAPQTISQIPRRWPIKLIRKKLQ